MLGEIVRRSARDLSSVARNLKPRLDVAEFGTVVYVGDDVARVRGLPGVRSEELVLLAGEVPGIALNLEADEVGVVLLGRSPKVRAGAEVQRTKRVVGVGVGEGFLGRIVSGLGEPLDGLPHPRIAEHRAAERSAPAIKARAPVGVPLQTGIKAIDTLVPIGRGQRELILGDRQTGKTSLAVDAIINQKQTGVLCVYCAIGQRRSAVNRVVEALASSESLDHTIVVTAAGDDPPGLQFITPYTATAIAEFFVDAGRDVLIVYDDLTRHARAYRELSLLLRRPPGREAYPGDVFYIHARLLERSARLSKESGGGSLTAIPIIETQAQNISAYIPTNLISITDGQIYVSPTLFQKGIRPAIDVGRSVSRVGGRAQLPSYHSVAATLRLAYAQFEELEVFSRLRTRLDDETRLAIDRGRRVREILKQRERSPMPVWWQIVVLVAVNNGLFDEVRVEDVQDRERAICEAIKEARPDLCRSLDAGGKVDGKLGAELLEAARRVSV